MLEQGAKPAKTSNPLHEVQYETTSYEVDPLTCRCGAQMRILSFILDPRVVTKILRHIVERIAEKGTARERAPPSSPLASGLHQSSGLLQVRS